MINLARQVISAASDDDGPMSRDWPTASRLRIGDQGDIMDHGAVRLIARKMFERVITRQRWWVRMTECDVWP